MIRESDRLADLLARDERLLEVIVGSSPELAGLRNPLTRRVMARLATVGQIARLAGLEPDILIRRINQALGDRPGAVTTHAQRPVAASAARAQQEESANHNTDMSTLSTDVPPSLAGLSPELICDLDVRDDLRNGREPFSRIMAAKSALPGGGVLRLRATFEPVPLYAVMGRQGYDHWTEQLADEDWRVWFYPPDAPRSSAADTPQDVAREIPSGGSIPVAPTLAGREPHEPGEEAEDLVVLDVRGLEPPAPMALTLAALERLTEGATLLQINERVPQFLIPRLAELGFEHEVREEQDGVVRVFIQRRVDRRASQP